MSPQFWQTLGYEPSKMAHLSAEWQDIIFAKDKAVALENFQKHCDDPSHPYDQIVRYKHFDGSTVWVRCRGMAVRDSSGRPVRMLGAHSNVTELKNAELRLVEKNDELMKYSYAVSHDLKAPIGNAALAMQVLEAKLGDALGDMERRLISEIGASMNRMVSVIEGLHKIAVLDSNDGSTDTFEVSEIMSGIEHDLGKQIADCNAQITLSDAATITTNQTLFSQVLYNLVLNSIKYRKEGVSPSIKISVVDHPSHWQIAVTDNGLGIEPKYQQKIFDFLQRLHANHEISGTGLGLSFCKKAVAHMGGVITVKSELNCGSTFSFTVAKRSQA